jgi:Fur family transcriptional regulator, peroxide stress response regulator
MNRGAASHRRDLERHLEQFRNRCASSGLAFTHQRQVIYRALMLAEDHPSPEGLYEQVRHEMPSISLATVYKTIKTFVELGLVREVSPEHATVRLDANLEPHHHFICLRCKVICDLREEDIEPVKLRRGLPKGFRAKRTAVEVLGLCDKCSREEPAA